MGEDREIVFEHSLSDEWSRDLGVIEVPLDHRPLTHLAVGAIVIALAIGARIVILAFGGGPFYAARAETNLFQFDRAPAPRGEIVDRYGEVLAENQPIFSALLDLNQFLRNVEHQSDTLALVERALGVPQDAVWAMVKERTDAQSGDPVVLVADLTQNQLIALKAEPMDTIRVVDNFKRLYPAGSAVAPLLGYLGYPTRDDLAQDATLSGQDLVGKSGIELYYDSTLRGTPGFSAKLRDARGLFLGDEKKTEPKIGSVLKLSIDFEFEQYFADVFTTALRNLGRTSGVGLAVDPRNGEVLAYLNFPLFDNNVFGAQGKSAERLELLNAPTRPLFNRAAAGLYNPGSTIKPLHALAALAEGVMDPSREIFSPGYLDVPNPYDEEHPTRFVDWRYQGNIDMYDAIAQSSNVYFYLAGGGSPQRDPKLGIEWDTNFGIRGVGISRLHDWWEKFRLGEATGIDLPGDGEGLLPTPEWKKERTGQPWFLGDTYNVSIGQGDFAVTPLALLNYIAAIANDGIMRTPVVNLERSPGEISADLTAYSREIEEVQKAMRRAVTSPEGTARLLATLPHPTAGKTGSAQVFNNTQENAFFVGYGPYDDPQIAILILVENAKEGSLNAVPIANDIFYWYYMNRIAHETQ